MEKKKVIAKVQQCQQTCSTEPTAEDFKQQLLVEAHQTPAGMRNYLRALRRAQFSIRGYEVVGDIEVLNISRSARFKLIKCFANHLPVDNVMVDFAFSAVINEKLGKVMMKRCE